MAVEDSGGNDGRKRRMKNRTSRNKWNNITGAATCKTTADDSLVRDTGK